jgi:hypothetical protein
MITLSRKSNENYNFRSIAVYFVTGNSAVHPPAELNAVSAGHRSFAHWAS